MAKKKCEAVTDCKVTPLIDLRAEYDEKKEVKRLKLIADIKKQACEWLPSVEKALIEEGEYKKALYRGSVDILVLERLKKMYSEAGYIATIEDDLKYEIGAYNHRSYSRKVVVLTIELKK